MNLKRTDVLSITAVVTVLFLLILVVLKPPTPNRVKAVRIYCVSNLKQVGLSFRILANDNSDLYPMNVGYKDPTLREAALSGAMFRIFQIMSNELSVPRTIICPADNRLPANDWEFLNTTNIGYFVGLDAEDARPNMVLSGDRNLSVGAKPLSGTVALGTNPPVNWTREIHGEEGNIALADGSVQQVTTKLFRQQLKYSGDATNLLVFPQ